MLQQTELRRQRLLLQADDLLETAVALHCDACRETRKRRWRDLQWTCTSRRSTSPYRRTTSCVTSTGASSTLSASTLQFDLLRRLLRVADRSRLQFDGSNVPLATRELLLFQKPRQ